MKRLFTIAALALITAGCQKNPPKGPEPVVLDFEAVGANYLAGPTSEGKNLYADFEGEQYTAWTDAATGITMGINEADGVRNFWNGGVAISRWNDMVAACPVNQCSVYYKDASTGHGGYGGSETFAVVNYSAYNDAGGVVAFSDAAAEAAFDHFWVNNSTYTARCMEQGNDFAAKFETGDWFLLTVTAEDAAGNATGTPVKFYLADLRTASSPGIVTEWTKVDLTPLGDRVHKVSFTLSSSDNDPTYGMNTPGYFCFDNLAILM